MESLRSHTMPELKHARQAPPGVGAAEQSTQPAQRKFIFHSIFQPAAIFSVWDEQMGMLPPAKRAGDHLVPEHAPRFASGVFGGPCLAEGAYAQANLDPRSHVFNSASLLNDLRILPRRRKLRQRIGQGVPIVNSVGGSGYLAAINEEFAHKP